MDFSSSGFSLKWDLEKQGLNWGVKGWFSSKMNVFRLCFWQTYSFGKCCQNNFLTHKNTSEWIVNQDLSWLSKIFWLTAILEQSRSYKLRFFSLVFLYLNGEDGLNQPKLHWKECLRSSRISSCTFKVLNLSALQKIPKISVFQTGSEGIVWWKNCHILDFE